MEYKYTESSQLSPTWNPPPNSSYKNLVALIKKHGTPQHALRSHIIPHNSCIKKVILIETGSWNLKISNSHIVNHLYQEAIFGLENIFTDQNPGITLESESNSLYYEISIKKIKTMLHDPSISIAIAEYIAWRNILALQYIKVMTNGDSYAKVKFAIEWLQRTSSVYKKNQPLVKFITDRTGLSKGHTHAILKQLREGNYIKLNAGYFKEICKKLPMKF